MAMFLNTSAINDYFAGLVGNASDGVMFINSSLELENRVKELLVKSSKCNAGNTGIETADIWAVIVLIIIAMIIYAYVSSKLAKRKQKKLREARIPMLSDNITTGIAYNLALSDGRIFEGIEVLGSCEGEDNEFSLGGWAGMLIIKQANGKKIYIKKTAVRYIEEC